MEDEGKVTSNDIIDLIPLDNKTNEIANKIINTEDISQCQDLVKLFNLNQAKKNVLRVLKLNSLLDHVSDEMINRFQNKPGEFANNDLLNYMNVVQNSIDRANKSLNLVDEVPNISLTQVNVNVEENKLDRDSRARVAEAVMKMLELAKSKKMDLKDDQELIPTELIKEESDERIDDSENSIESNNQDTSMNNRTKLLNEEE